MDKLKRTCPNCCQVYHQGTTSKGNIPLLLACGHSMCENCVGNIVKFGEPIECKICHRDMEISKTDMSSLTQNKIKLYNLFPVNFFMLGELSFQNMEGSSHKKLKENEDENFYIDLQSIIKSTDNTQGECLECHNSTTKMCKQCATILCDTCFNKTHKNFVIFKNHTLSNIEPLSEFNFCKIHKDKALDYYCKDCSKSVCMDCMMVGGEKSCKNHNVVSMQEVNTQFIEQLIEIKPKVDETFKRLTKTAVDVGNLLHNIANDTGSTCELTNMVMEIEQHFSKLTSIIQKHKTEVIDIIMKLKYSERESLRKAKNDIANAIKLSKKVLNTISATSSEPEKNKQLNLAALLENATKITEIPWYLSRDENNSDPLKVSVNEDLCALISDYIHLEGNIKSVYRLRSTSEIGENVVIPPAPPGPVFPPELPRDVRQQTQAKAEKKDTSQTKPGFYKKAPKYRTKSGSVSSLNSLDSDYSYITSTNDKPTVQHVQPFQESQHPKQLQEESQELIYISHIVDPHNFFVQRSFHQSLIKDMLREFRNATSLPKPSVSHVAEGKVYLMFNKADNMWQRCRVLSIDRRNIDKPNFQVFCFDFGSTEIVTVDKLRLLPPARLQSPYPLAINCCLANCEPKNGSWTCNDAILMQNIIDNKQAVIHIRRIRPTHNYMVTLECDVTTFEDGVSIAHALVFHERAKLTNPRLHYPKIKGVMEKPKLFMNNNDFKPKSTEEVYITHIISPDKFFVRKRHLQDIYDKLAEDLEQEYSANTNDGKIFNPEIGMVCVVNTEKYSAEICGAWARGVVVELPGRGRARVVLPDVGVLLLVHWAALRRPRQRFTTLRALATECYLAGVTPLNKKWSPGSVALLQKYEDRLLELHVEDSRSGAIGVTLYDRADTDDPICVNNEMIKYKFAVTFGVFKFNKNNIEEQVITNKSPLEEPKIARKPQKGQVYIQKKEEPAQKKITEVDLKAKDKGPLRLEAKVLNCQSPSLLYVTLNHQQKVFSELYEKIQKYYSNKKAEVREDWKEGDKCATFCNQSQTWRRAVIIEIVDMKAKVFYSDFACVETVPLTELRDLPHDLTSIGDAAIKCHLCGVMPAVGEEWPSLTKEYLKELLDVYKRVFITKLGNFKNKSMPVEIWVYHTIQGSALEANKSEWRCLNKKIIEQGLGIPDKSLVETGVEHQNANDTEMLSFLNMTGSIQEWLQLEPLPVKPLLSKSDSENNTPIPEDCDDSNMKSDEFDAQISNTVFVSDWLPPEPLPNKEFTGMPTYIDNDGVIYLHDVSQNDTLDLIRKALDVRFKNPDPKAKYAKWTVGEPCIAMYFLDNRFYRGKVVEVNKEAASCLIHYVDFGNDEICSYENLRKSVALYQIPMQAHRCVLDRIKPIGDHWDRQTLDYIHKSVVEKECFVKISKDKIGDIHPIELKYNKLWINDHLVDFEMAAYSDGSHAVIRKFAPVFANEHENIITAESDSGPDYILEDDNETDKFSLSHDSIQDMKGKDWNKLINDDTSSSCDDENSEINDKCITYPKLDKMDFLCNVAVINDINLLELSVVHDDETNLLYEEMFENLQKDGENMTPLNDIFENKACVALFPDDGKWYRASILQYSETKGQVKVRYVDYGNIEVISLADIREIPKDYVRLPAASIQVKLQGVKLNPNVDLDAILQEYSITFLDKGPFQAKITNNDEMVPTVELKNDDDVLVYKSLFDKEIFLS